MNAIAQAEEGVYVAYGKGLQLYGSDGTKDLIKDEAVVGVVSMGDGSVLAATDTQLWLIDKDDKHSLMNTTSADSFLKLEGTKELAWGAHEVRHLPHRREGEAQPRPREARPAAPHDAGRRCSATCSSTWASATRRARASTTAGTRTSCLASPSR